MDKINVSLYGGKSIFKGVRETPLEADVIYCDHYKQCDLFKEGKCLHKREVGDRGRKCIYGKVEKYQGYTSRAKKYWSFRTRFTNDAVYEKLDRAGDVRVARIGDYIYLNTSYLHVKIENGKIVTLETAYSAYFPQGRVFIPKEVFSEDILYQILSFVPHSNYGIQRRNQAVQEQGSSRNHRRTEEEVQIHIYKTDNETPRTGCCPELCWPIRIYKNNEGW